MGGKHDVTLERLNGEVVFFNSGNISCDHNSHTTLNEPNQNQFSINIWAGVFGDFVIGPFLLPPGNGNSYLNFLQGIVPHLIENVNVPVNVQEKMWFHHDGAPAPFAHYVKII